MTLEPREQDTIFESLKARLTSKVAGLTNFTERSFNYIFTQAFASELRKLELQAIASQLSGYIEYADGNLDENDLVQLGIDDVVDEPDEINQYMSDENLDALAKEVGIERNPGRRATGSVDFQTQSALTVIPEGTIVTTSESGDEVLRFETTEQARTDSGVTIINDVPVQSIEIGAKYNVPADTVVRIETPPVGIVSVNNGSDITGGKDRESNERLRERAKKAVESSSQGGTTAGIKAFLRDNVDGVTEGNTIIDEFVDENPPRVDVIVDGGVDSEVRDAIEQSRPTGIQHSLVRPQIITLGLQTSLTGSTISTDVIQTAITNYVTSLGVNENYLRNEAISRILNADRNVLNVENIDGIIESVSNEKFVYDETVTDYRLDFTFDKTYGDIRIIDDSDIIYERTVDFEVVDVTGDGFPDTIRWLTGQSSADVPSNGERFSVDYDVTVIGETLDRDYYTTDTVRDETFTFNLDREEVFEYLDSVSAYSIETRPFDGTTTVVELDQTGDPVGSPFVKGESWQLAPLDDDGSEDTFTFNSGTLEYTLTDRITTGTVAIIDADKRIYEEGVDYKTLDTDGDGVDDTISWDTTDSSAEQPPDGTAFTVNYDCCAQFIRWDQSGDNPVPSNGANVRATFDQQVYETEYEIVESERPTITDESG
jgi:Uncharacterized homolog of phage Mu protein gp47